MPGSDDLSGGWIKLHRKIERSAIWGSAELVYLWVWCLIRANHAETWVRVRTGRGTTEVLLQPGQFITGRYEGSSAVGMKPESFRSRLSKLEKLGNLTTQHTTQYTIVTICNWESYQNGNCDDRHELHHTNTTQTPHKHHTNTTDKNDKNDRSKEEQKKQLLLNAEAVERVFARFWGIYPRKVGKGQAQRAWRTATKATDPEVIMAGLVAQLPALLMKDRQYTPHPATWLNGRRWEDSPNDVSGEPKRESAADILARVDERRAKGEAI